MLSSCDSKLGLGKQGCNTRASHLRGLLLGGPHRKGSQRSTCSMSRGRIGTTEQTGGDVAVDKVESESDRDPEVEVLGDRLSSSSTPV